MSIVNDKLARAKTITSNWTTARTFAICLSEEWTFWCWNCWCSTSPKRREVGFKHSATGNLVELVWRELAIFRNWFHDSNHCISSYLCVLGLVTHFYPTLSDPIDCSPPGSSVYGDSPSKNTRVGSHDLLQGIFWTYGSNPGLPHLAWVIREAPSYLEKHYNTERWHQFLMTGRNAFCQVSAWLHRISYTHLAPPPLGAVSQGYVRCCLPGSCVHFAPNITHNSQVVHLS